MNDNAVRCQNASVTEPQRDGRTDLISSEAERRRFHPSRARISSCEARFHFFDSEVFQNFVDAFLRGALLAHLFGSVDRFEPAKCIF